MDEIGKIGFPCRPRWKREAYMRAMGGESKNGESMNRGWDDFCNGTL